MILALAKPSILLVVTFLAAHFLRRWSAALRHLVWTSGLIAALAIPLLEPLTPSWDIARSRVYTRVQDQDQTEIVAVRTDAGIKPAAAPRPVHIPKLIWLAGSCIAAFMLLVSGLRLAWVSRRAVLINSEAWAQIENDIRRPSRLKRPIRLLRHPELPVLGTWGIFNCRVLLPSDAETWPEERVRVVLAHELAHIRRKDWALQRFAEIARAVYWFNPLFWAACRRMRQESEHACDDAVISLGIDPHTYAAHLLALARALKHPQSACPPILAMAQPPHLERRFAAMMNPSIDHRSVSRKAALAAFALAIGMTTPVAAMRIGGVESSPPLMMPVLVPAAKAAAAPGAGPARKPARTPRSATKPMQTPAGGSVGGTVFDASGAVIPGVTVVLSVIEQTQSGLSEHPVLTAVTGPAGEFLFRSLAARQYSLKAELPGFLSLRSGSFELKPGQALNENLTLALGSVVQKVEVQAVGPQTPLPPGTPRRVRVGGNVRAPALIAPVKPLYPRAARDAGIEGMVRLQGIIATDGSILALSVLNADAGEDLKDAAMDAVQQWRYRPTLLNGVPVEVLTTIEVDFKLVH